MKKEKGTKEKMKKEKERKRKRAYSCLKKQPYALYRELSLKRNYRLSGQCNALTITAQQCINDYCTILKRIRNE